MRIFTFVNIDWLLSPPTSYKACFKTLLTKCLIFIFSKTIVRTSKKCIYKDLRRLSERRGVIRVFSKVDEFSRKHFYTILWLQPNIQQLRHSNVFQFSYLLQLSIIYAYFRKWIANVSKLKFKKILNCLQME